ncbi:glycoside hydrolase family 16 protein [Dichomitus squalens]|uniref:Glycoside hydrolase family 16 protein n=1 Tax=Dichomitus squalens TaxID=114155 RepID=A0A4V2K085_9APHY|nr:glycoside hydrolase family 16 protein [Dichomitus squalens]
MATLVVVSTSLSIASSWTYRSKWPYSYNACDMGIVANQTVNNLLVAATEGNDAYNNGALSESHPGPVHDNGEYVGRSAPEIDMFEAQIGGTPMGDGSGAVSQSGQWAPFNWKYTPLGEFDVPDLTRSVNKSYTGGVYQQATSVVTATDQTAYEFNGYGYSVYDFQYKPGFGDAYISWIATGQLAWSLHWSTMGPDAVVEISDRPVSQEPMYLIMNLGISEAFGEVEYDILMFPLTMRIDWIRVYQDPNAINIGCDPPDFPTAAYIAQDKEAYANPDLTTWVNDYKQETPKNKFLGQC